MYFKLLVANCHRMRKTEFVYLYEIHVENGFFQRHLTLARSSNCAKRVICYYMRISRVRDIITCDCDGNATIKMTNLSPASGPTSYPAPGLALVPLAAAFSARGPFLGASSPAPRVGCWRTCVAPSRPVCPFRSAVRPRSAAARRRVDPAGIQCRSGCQILKIRQNSKLILLILVVRRIIIIYLRV